MNDQAFGFAEDEIQTAESTRSARLKWVIVVDSDLPTGRVVNAAVCVAAATPQDVTGLLGRGGTDGAGSAHAGLPWAGCSILAGDAATLQRVRASAEAHPEVYVADMPLAAQETRVYDDYLTQLAGSAPDQIAYAAVSLVGPRKRVDRIVGRLKLLS
jgi:hypothetical protein